MTKISRTAGLEPTRDEPNRFLVDRLNRSATSVKNVSDHEYINTNKKDVHDQALFSAKPRTRNGKNQLHNPLNVQSKSNDVDSSKYTI